MTKQELMELWREARQRLHDSVKGVTESEASIMNTLGKWSLKDVIAHLVYWDEELVRSVNAVLEKRRPRFLDEDWDMVNARETARRKEQTLKGLLEDLKKSGKKVQGALRDVDEKQFSASSGQKWKMWEVTVAWLVSGNIEHDYHHANRIEAWRATHQL